MKKLLVLFVILGAFIVQAMVSHIKIRGEIIKYDKYKVVLEQETGKRVVVPRRNIPTKFGKLRTGQKVYALSFDEKKLKFFQHKILKSEKAKQKFKRRKKLKK